MSRNRRERVHRGQSRSPSVAQWTRVALATAPCIPIVAPCGACFHLTAHEVDLQDREGVRRTLVALRPDWVFHLGAYGGYSHQIDFNRMIATNLMGSAALLDACAEVGVEAFVQAGSSSEYGYKDHPAGEEELLEPNSPYAITKAAATHYCQFTAHTQAIRAVTARLYSVYGPYEEPTRLIPTLVVKGLNGKLPQLASPNVARDFIHVDEAVEALLLLASDPRVRPGAVYNICSGIQSSLRSVVAIARQLMGISVEPDWSTMPNRSWDTDVWVGSPSLLMQEINWRAQMDLETGLGQTINWFREHPQWLRFYSSRISA